MALKCPVCQEDIPPVCTPGEDEFHHLLTCPSCFSQLQVALTITTPGDTGKIALVIARRLQREASAAGMNAGGAWASVKWDACSEANRTILSNVSQADGEAAATAASIATDNVSTFVSAFLRKAELTWKSLLRMSLNN